MPSAFDLGFGVTPNEIAVEHLPVQGVVPAWLTGTLVRNGPGTFRVGTQQYRHWFDGLAMLHRFGFAGGRVSYANRYLETRAWTEARAQGRISYSEFATDPCRSLFGRVMAVFSPRITDSAKVSVARIADRYLALAETPIQVEFDPETLRTAGVFSYEPGTTGQMTTVHPHVDGDQAYNLVTRYHRVSHYRVYGVRAHREPVRIADLPVREPAYLHSFGMSQRYFVIAEYPLVVNPVSLLLWLRPYIENFRWKPSRGTTFHVIDRATGQRVARFESDACFAFHHVNAFESDGDLVVDLVAYDDASIIDGYYLHRLSDTRSELPWGRLRRYRLPLGRPGGRVSGETLSDACIELPRFDAGRRNLDPSYRFVYGVSLQPSQRRGFYNQLVRIDTRGGPVRTWSADGCYPGEAVFVPEPDGTREEQGVVLSVVLDAQAGRSFLLVLDAATFEEQARAVIPHAVLFGYHGEFFGDAGRGASAAGESSVH